MRATIKDAVKHPSWISSWWIDLPMRKRWWWQMALFAPGEGWLRWEHAYRSEVSYNPPDSSEWAVYPPLRRGWRLVYWIVKTPLLMVRENLSWKEARPDFSFLRADPDRKKELWR